MINNKLREMRNFCELVPVSLISTVSLICTGLLFMEFTGGFPPQKASNGESVSMWWTTSLKAMLSFTERLATESYRNNNANLLDVVNEVFRWSIYTCIYLLIIFVVFTFYTQLCSWTGQMQQVCINITKHCQYCMIFKWLLLYGLYLCNDSLLQTVCENCLLWIKYINRYIFVRLVLYTCLSACVGVCGCLFDSHRMSLVWSWTNWYLLRRCSSSRESHHNRVGLWCQK